jgi:hypothetical protein
MGILFIIYHLHYMPYMFTPKLYAFSQPFYHVSADFAQHIWIDSSTKVCNSLPKVTKISYLTAYTSAFMNPQDAKYSPFHPMLMPFLPF